MGNGSEKTISIVAMLGLVTSVFTFSTAVQPVAAQNPSFGSAINLSNDAESSDAQQIAVSGTNVYVVWQNFIPSNTNDDIFFSRSTDNGATFSTLNLSNNNGQSDSAQIAASGSNVFVIWHDGGSIVFSRSTDNGATFSTPVNISNSIDTISPQIAVSGTNVYVVWVGAGGASFDIFFSRSADNGATFSTPVNISNNVRGLVPVAPHVAASGTNVYIVWYADGIGDFRISFSASTDNGATFSTPLNISNIALRGTHKIAASGSNVYVIWLAPGDNSDAETFFSRSIDNGATFSTPLNISNNAGDADQPQMAASGSDVYLVWSEGSVSSDIFFSRSTDNGATLSTPVSISNGVGDSFEAQIAVSANNLYVVWDAGIGGANFDIFFSRSTDNGATFSTPVNISSSAGDSFEPRIAVSGTNVYVSWEDTSPGNLDIFFRASVEIDTDSDDDGIFDQVDTLPATFSNDFSDVGFGGATTGTITARGNQILTIKEEPNPAGVRAKADPSGGLLPATISACGGTGLFTLNPGDELVITCGSVTAQVISGTVEITFVAPDNTLATVNLNAGNSMTFEPTAFTFTAPPTNSETVVVIIEGKQFSISPGQTITPSANNAPNCSTAVPSHANLVPPIVLWPPNHTMKDITVQGVTDLDGDTITITITSIKQDEPTSGLGDGDQSPDGTGIGTSTAQVRVERSGTVDGRVYHIFFTANDGKEGTCNGEVFVSVPINQSDTAAVDQGALYDSTVP